jgi:hypothetical protein
MFDYMRLCFIYFYLETIKHAHAVISSIEDQSLRDIDGAFLNNGGFRTICLADIYSILSVASLRIFLLRSYKTLMC